MQARIQFSGALIAIAAMAGLGLLELARGEALPGLHPHPEGWPALIARVSGLVLFLLAAASLRWPAAAAGLALHWLTATILVGASVAANPSDPLAWVPLMQAFAFAAFAVWLWRRPGALAQRVLRSAFGAMLVLFGAIHLTHVEAIAGLIPDFVPGAAIWPWITGGVQIVAGIACLAGRGVWVTAGAIALMYLAWLPIVHAPRLLASPESTFEWTFALTALALAGSVGFGRI